MSFAKSDHNRRGLVVAAIRYKSFFSCMSDEQKVKVGTEGEVGRALVIKIGP